MVEESEEDKYKRFAQHDPFPEIPATLLQSGHIWSYVLKTGMISPFEPLSLKPATYEVKLGGKCVIFDEEGRRTTFFLGTQPNPEYPGLEARPEIVLVRNSIVFLTLDPFFRLPYYIAARFNLKIKNIYRGLLLGTGPIVDPGFYGRLSLPLHNLTNNRYVYSAGEPFAWFEFTKTSWRPAGSKLGSRTQAYSGSTSPYTPDNLYEDGAIEIHQPFPQEKLRRHDVSDYLEHANGGTPVQSSLPPVLIRVERLTRTTERRLNFFSIVGVIALIALLIGVFQVIDATISMVHDISRKQGELSSKVDILNDKAITASNTERNNETIQKVIDDFRKELAAAVARASTPGASEFRQLETRLLELESRVNALSNPSRKPRQP